MITYKGVAPTQHFFPKLLHRRPRRPSLSSQKKLQAIALRRNCTLFATLHFSAIALFPSFPSCTVCILPIYNFCHFLAITIQYRDLPLLLWETAKDQVPCISDHLPCNATLFCSAMQLVDAFLVIIAANTALGCYSSLQCKSYVYAILDCKSYTLIPSHTDNNDCTFVCCCC